MKTRRIYCRAYRLVRGLYFTMLAVGFCAAAVLYLAKPHFYSSGTTEITILREPRSPFPLILRVGHALSCRLPDTADIRRYGLSVTGNASFSGVSGPVSVSVMAGDRLVGVFRLDRPGRFRRFVSLHTLPEGADAPLRFTMVPLAAIGSGVTLKLDTAKLLPVDGRPAETVAELLASPDPAWYPREIRELRVGSGSRAAESARELTLSRDPRGTPSLIAEFKSSMPGFHILKAFFTLGDIGIPDLIRHYYDSMAEGDIERAMRVLWTIRAPVAHDFLKTLLIAPDRRAAVYAAGTLAMMGDDSGIPVAVRGLDDPDPVVRVDACWAIGKSRDETARRLAYPVARSEYENAGGGGYVRGQSMHALSNLGRRESLPFYLEWLKSDRAGERLHGFTGIARLNDPSLIPLLLDAFRSEKDDSSYAIMLYFMPVKEVSPQLVEALYGMTSEAGRLAIARYLAREGDPGVAEALESYAEKAKVSDKERGELATAIRSLRSRLRKAPPDAVPAGDGAQTEKNARYRS